MSVFKQLSCYLLIFFLHCGTVMADYDQGMRYAFVASRAEKTISIIDLHDRRLAETVTLEKTPGEIAASDRLDALAITYPSEKQLGLIDLSSYRLKQDYYDLSITPHHIKLDPIGDTLAVYDDEQDILEVHDLDHKKLLVKINNVNTSVPVTFNRDGKLIFWIDNRTGELKSSNLNGKPGSVKLTANGQGLSAMTRSVDGSMGFISDALARKVYIVNLRRMSLMKEVPVGQRPGRAWGTADGRSMIVPNYDSGTITAISTFTLDPIYTINATSKPVAVNTGWLDTTAAVIGEAGDIALINLDNRETVKTMKLHGEPKAGVVTSDSRLLALPVEGNGDVFIFDMKSLLVEERIIELPNDLGGASLAISNNLCH